MSNDKLNEILGLPEEVSEKVSQPAVPRPVQKEDDEDVDIDYKYQRENLYNLIEKGQDAIEGILDVAKEAEHPRAYEVAGNLIKNVADITDKLIDLQGKMKKMKESDNKKANTINNNLYVGSTAELQKMLNNRSREKNE